MADETSQHHIHVSDHAVATDELRVTVTLTADGVVTPAPTDSIGLTVEQTYKLTKSPLAGDQYHYELTRQDGTVLDSGVGNKLTDVLFGLALGAEARELGDADPDS